MISSLFKNRGLRLQLLVGVGLLLVLGTFPGSEGILCYSCDDGGKDPRIPKCTRPDYGQCPDGSRHCFFGAFDAGNGRKEQRGCMPKVQIECLKEQFAGSNCVAGDGGDEAHKAALKLKYCEDKVGGRKEGSRAGVFLRQCFCDTDYCNTEEECTCPTGGGGDGDGGSGGGGGGGSGGDDDSASILHPFNSFIIAILTVAFYNYIY